MKDNLAVTLYSLAKDRQHIINTFKNSIKQKRAQLEQTLSKHFQAKNIIAAWTQFIDDLLIQAWNYFNFCEQDICLIAVGGYGRNELFPYSDIDLLILTTVDTRASQSSQIAEFISLCWDMGLEIGHSVRSCDECLQHAADDLSVMTNLLETRLLIGSPTLWQNLLHVISTQTCWPSHAFFQAKIKEQTDRYQKFNLSANNLEPNIKNGPGGLRDITLIGWLAAKHFATYDFAILCKNKFLTKKEYRSLISSQHFLWKVRIILQFITNRNENRLLFDYQIKIAKLLGFNDNENELAIEQLMKKYFRAVKEIRALNEVLIQSLHEIIIEPKDTKVIPLNEDFQIYNNTIEVTHKNIFRSKPIALLEIFLLTAQHPQIEGIRANTIRLLREYRYLINKSFRNNLAYRKVFMQILQQPNKVAEQLQRMNSYGLLGRYVPAFGHVIGQMQYDLYHIYTVDQHTLFLIGNLERFCSPAHQDEFPLCSQIMQQLAKPELAYLAALFHDIAKGRGGDHSSLGEIDARRFCKKHQLSKNDIELVSWLVKNHLLMSVTAQRKDIHDPLVIDEFISQIKQPRFLDYLYILTVADICATNTKLWNSWKDSLLKSLYMLAKDAIQQTPRAQVEIIRAKKEQALATLATLGLERKPIIKLWSHFGNNYFLNNSKEEIIWHTQHLIHYSNGDKSLILANKTIQHDCTTLFIYTPDQKHLFASSVAVLSNLGLNIVEARIITSKHGYSLNSYNVLNEADLDITLPENLALIARQLEYYLTQSVPPLVRRHISRSLRNYPMATEVKFYDDINRNYTVLEIITIDHPGLLAKIGIAFIACDVRVLNAKIVTLDQRVEDIFYITNNNDTIFTEHEKEQLKQKILELLELKK